MNCDKATNSNCDCEKCRPDLYESKPAMYTAYYCFNGKDYSVDTERGLNAFKNGFWININKKLTTGSDCKYWIPPGQIKYIKKTGGVCDV